MKANEFSKTNDFSAKQTLTVLDVALQLAKHGKPVFPMCSHNHSGTSEQHRQKCKRPGKAPLISDWVHRSSYDPAQIQAWFAQRPNLNAGLVLGQRSGILAIDVDGDFGREKLEELSNGDLPPTWQYATPGGGYRYLYEAPTDSKFQKASFSSETGSHEALELLGDGQCTVIPGSIHANGGVYAWEDGCSPGELALAPAPDWMLKRMNPLWVADALFEDTTQNGEPNPSQEDFHEGFSEEVGICQALTEKHALTASSDVSAHLNDATTPLLKHAANLERLVKGCPRLSQIIEQQTNGGCSEDDWFRTTSLLMRMGKPEEARIFSQASEKHDERSAARLVEMENEAKAKAFGPTRCTTFGCSTSQVKSCFGDVRMKNEEVSNSPAELLRKTQPKPLEIIQSKLVGTNYRIKGGKVGDVTFDKKGEESLHPIANFVAFASSSILVQNGIENEYFFEIEGIVLENAQPLQALEVRQDDFESMNWLMRWGLKANLEPGLAARQKMRHLIQLLSKNTQQKDVYAHLGFRQFPGGWGYLHGNGCVGKENVEVLLDQRLEKYMLHKPTGPLEKPIQASLNLLNVAKREVTLPLLSAVFLSPLCEVLRQKRIEPAFLLWLYGTTGTRKSTISALFMNHFGKFSPKSPPASFKDTANSLEKRAFDCKDSLLWIDDFHPSASTIEARKMEQTAQALVRSFGDRAGRGRLKQDSSSRNDYVARGVALVTGEQQISGHSSNARIQGVEIRPDDIDLAKLTEAQSRMGLLSETMAGYVAWVGQQMSEPSFGERLQQDFHERRNLALPGQSHGRLAENSAWLFLGWDTFLRFVVYEGVLTETEYQARRADGWNTLLCLSDQQSDQVSDSRPGEAFLSIVGELLQNGTLHTLPIGTNACDTEGALIPRGTHVGWHDNERFFFLPGVLYNEVNTFLSKRQEQIPLKITDLWRQLHLDGVLEPEIVLENNKSKTKFSRRKSINGVRIPTIWIDRSAIVESDPEARDLQKARAAAVARQQASTQDLFGD